MGVSPRSSLYRTARWAATLAGLSLIVGQITWAQYARHETSSKGPRALGLVELAADGKAHLIPICILYESQFYDASAFKAAPVPMALYSGTVYEGLRTGVSEGLFTVSGALQTRHEDAQTTWMGVGTWRTSSEIAAAVAAKKQPAPMNRPEEEQGPPVLHRPGAEKSEPPKSDSEKPAPAQAAPSTTPPSPATPAPVPPPAPLPVDQDPNRPHLRRGIPDPAKSEVPDTSSVMAVTAAPTPGTSAPTAASTVQTIPAISDAVGPEPRPYSYKLRPDEEMAFQKKMLVLATIEVRSRAQQLAAGMVGVPASQRSSPASKTSAKGPQPTFEDVHMRVFDLSTSNEPVLVLSAKAHMPQAGGTKASTGTNLEYLVTLVARDDIYGELHKAFSNLTDTRHLDVIPRFELIDAVDADGDGRGELLFRKISSDGTTYAVYRAIGDQLWPLFEGSLGK